MRELLTFYKFPGDEIPIVRGSALHALNGTEPSLGKDKIVELMKAVDDYIPEPARDMEKPFLMPVILQLIMQTDFEFDCMPQSPDFARLRMFSVLRVVVLL